MPSLDPYTIQPMTLLDAVNIVLGSIGRNALLSLDSINLNSDGESAMKQVHNNSMHVQQQGWHFNTEMSLKLDPNEFGRIEIPLNTLKVDTVGQSADLDLTWRGKFLYDRIGHTLTIGKSVTVDLVVGLDFEELPQAARTYITMKASRSFAQFKLGQGATNQFTQQDVGEALLALLELEDEADDRTLQDKNGRIARRRNRFYQG